jgi:hypothetical protein
VSVPRAYAFEDWDLLHNITLRGRTKVDAQWKLFTMVHNLEKIFRNAYTG